MIRRGEPKLDEGTGRATRRTCHNPKCSRTFQVVETFSGESTEYHCSGECAWACYKNRRPQVVVDSEPEPAQEPARCYVIQGVLL